MLRSDHSLDKERLKLFPDSIWRDRWDMVWFLALLYNALVVPFMLCMVPDWVNPNGSCMISPGLVTLDIMVSQSFISPPSHLPLNVWRS